MATAPIASKTTVSTKRKELRAILPTYTMVQDCLDGQVAIKGKGTLYLPMPNASDKSEENGERYDAYKTRAVFYNVTQRTLNGMVGEVFSKDPMVEGLPTRLDVVAEDANGEGLTLTQLAKRAVRHTLAMGRGGILADYPTLEASATIADVEAGEVQPIITVYCGPDIVSWRTLKNNTKTKLTQVVLRELYDKEDDGFVVTQGEQYRVLRLEDGVYTVEVYREGKSQGKAEPKKADGKPFNDIPFTFIGSENNDAEIDFIPLADLAVLNVAHYRNSADYEESSFICGQPTLFISGLRQDWVTEVLKGKVALGSRSGVLTHEGCTATLLTATPNILPGAAMETKEKQMVALGAKLVENREVQRTAKEAGIAKASETSILSDVAKNVSAAIRFALEQCALFVGEEVADLIYELNTDYSLSKMSPQERAQTIAEWQQGAITFSEMRAVLRKSGAATLDDDEARKEIAEDVEFLPGGEDEDPDDVDDENDGKKPKEEQDPNKPKEPSE